MTKGTKISKIAKICALTMTLIATEATYAQGCCNFMEPYLGADVQNRYIRWSGDANSIFSKNYLQGDIYGGIQFCDYLGLELGYEASLPKTVNHTLSISSNAFLGVPSTGAPLLSPLYTQGKFEISGWQASLLGAVPIIIPEIQGYFSLGVAYLKTIHQATIFGDGSAIAKSPTPFLYTNSIKKTVFRWGTGLTYLFDPCTGLKLSLDWENTSRFKNLSNQFAPNARSVSLKNSWIYGIGIFTKF